jgi:Flp pilus assembly protein TadB
VALDPKTRRELAKNARLWGLALVCALAGSITVSVTGAVAPGVLAFAIALAVLGPLLLVYERRHR